ncbi:hypothetical protein [uncultured Ruegeria sp.]|uniref:hypothetical protein n=1 Tax=uncultured Ruegeria sp. TaxID=259304 RepID=UPI002624A53E|nr:hypothetical protein [uncultured Ruegeria sp.]
MTVSVTLPWPPKELSPNFRTRSHRLVSVRRKEYRKACFDAAWDRGIRPVQLLALKSVTFHPSGNYGYDDDNLRSRFKAGRDGLAEAMGVDDRTFNDVPHELGAVVKGGAIVALLEEIPVT